MNSSVTWLDNQADDEEEPQTEVATTGQLNIRVSTRHLVCSSRVKTVSDGVMVNSHGLTQLSVRHVKTYPATVSPSPTGRNRLQQEEGHFFWQFVPHV